MGEIIDFAAALRRKRGEVGGEEKKGKKKGKEEEKRRRPSGDRLPRSEPRPDRPLPSHSAPLSSFHAFVPVVTLAKGKFTLAVVHEDGDRFLSLYNTASKVEIARRRVGNTRRPQWVRWAELVAEAWQNARG